MLMAVQVYGNGLTDVRQIQQLFSIITPLTRNVETARSVIDGYVGAVHRTSDLMGTLVFEIGMGQSLNNTADPDYAAAEGEYDTGITPFPPDFCEEQVLVIELVHVLIHNNTDIHYQMLVVPREHLC